MKIAFISNFCYNDHVACKNTIVTYINVKSERRKEINDRNMWSYGKQKSRQHELKILFTFNIIASGIVYYGDRLV